MKRKKISRFLFSVAMLLGFSFVASASESDSIFFDPSEKVLSKGESFTFKAEINPGANQVTAVVLYVNFPKDKIQCQSIVADSTKWNVLTAGAVNNSEGQASITVGVAPGGGITTSSAVATLTCKASIAGTGSFSFDNKTEASAVGKTGNVIKTYKQMNFSISDNGTAPPTPTVANTPTPTVTPTVSATPINTPTASYATSSTPTVYATVLPTVVYSYSSTIKTAPASGAATNIALLLSASALITLGAWVVMKKMKG